MSKFDAAAKVLQWSLHGADTPFTGNEAEEVTSALRVLEAAAKVDKAWACGDGPDDPEKAQAVNELLHALPDDTDAKEKP